VTSADRRDEESGRRSRRWESQVRRRNQTRQI